MLELHFTSSESHKASFVTITHRVENLCALFTLVIYKADRIAGEQVVNVLELETMVFGKTGEKPLHRTILTVPEAHEAYQLFLKGTSEDLETYLQLKLKQTLVQLELPPCKSLQAISSSENSNPDASK